MRDVVACLGVLLAIGCSGSGEGAARSDPSDAAGGSGGSSSNFDAAPADTGTAGSDSGSADAGPSDGGGTPVALPAGSRELDGIVNLVDPAAAAELEAQLHNPARQFITLRHSFNKSVNLFLEHYQEAYDFLYLFSDRPLPSAPVAGIYEPITRRAAAGGVSEYEIAAEGYRTTGRLKGVAAFPYRASVYPPLAHETAHHWAAYLDARFGFGTGFDASSSYPLHWGYASVNGQLGGFDGTTLRCETPAGTAPPGCTAGAGGRVRFVTGSFAPQSNVFRGVAYAPLELYLMGLVPVAQVPASIRVLSAAKIVSSGATSAVVEASGISTVTLAQIVARHGAPALLPAGSRHFDAAFVVVSSAPAPESVLKEVATFAAVFGKRRTVASWKSFEEHTGGRATMTTALGARRAPGNAPPPARRALTCDALAQNCGRPELGCYVSPPAVCALSGRVPRDQPCNAIFACAPGLDCVSGAANPSSFVCKPYCNAINDTATNACARLCPANHFTFKDDGDNVIAGLCQPN